MKVDLGLQRLIASAIETVARETVARVDANGFDAGGTNVLSAAGNAVSREVRRRILLGVLREMDWNFARTAMVLGMSGGSSVVRREIFALGLDQEHANAVATGKVRPGPRGPRNVLPKGAE